MPYNVEDSIDYLIINPFIRIGSLAVSFEGISVLPVTILDGSLIIESSVVVKKNPILTILCFSKII